jgi:hypothetical protein
MRWRKRAAQAVALVAASAGMALGTTTATANTQPSTIPTGADTINAGYAPDALDAVSPNILAASCLSSDASAGELVAYDNFDGTGVALRCGDGSYGVRKIAADHGVTASDNNSLPECMHSIAVYGQEEPANQGRVRYQIKRPRKQGGGTANLVYRVSDNEVVTMYTSGKNSGNWAACARFPN